QADVEIAVGVIDDDAGEAAVAGFFLGDQVRRDRLPIRRSRGAGKPYRQHDAECPYRSHDSPPPRAYFLPMHQRYCRPLRMIRPSETAGDASQPSPISFVARTSNFGPALTT